MPFQTDTSRASGEPAKSEPKHELCSQTSDRGTRRAQHQAAAPQQQACPLPGLDSDRAAAQQSHTSLLAPPNPGNGIGSKRCSLSCKA